MNTMTRSLRLLVLLPPYLLRQAPLPSRAPIIGALYQSCSVAGAGFPARFARAVLANASLWRWYLQIRYLVGLASTWQPLLRLPRPGALSSYAFGLVRCFLLARESTLHAASRYRYAGEHIVRLYVSLISTFIYPTLPMRRALKGSPSSSRPCLRRASILCWTPQIEDRTLDIEYSTESDLYLNLRETVTNQTFFYSSITSPSPSRFPSSCPSRCNTSRHLSAPWKGLSTP